MACKSLLEGYTQYCVGVGVQYGPFQKEKSSSSTESISAVKTIGGGYGDPESSTHIPKRENTENTIH